MKSAKGVMKVVRQNQEDTQYVLPFWATLKITQIRMLLNFLNFQANEKRTDCHGSEDEIN